VLLFLFYYARFVPFVTCSLSAPVQLTGWKICLQNDLLCVERDVKPY